MSQAGFTPISLYFSATGAAVPVAGNLVAGELALNTNDGKLYFKNSSGVVTLLAGSSAGPAGGSDTQVQYNNAGVLGGITGATTNGTALTLVAPVLGTPASGTVTNLTGTASININGTVGATTPTTGAFTSGTFSTTLGVTGLATFNNGGFSSPSIICTGTATDGLLQIFQGRNTSAGTSAKTRFALGNNLSTAGATISLYSSTHTTNPNYFDIQNEFTAPLRLSADGGTTFVTFTSTGVTIPGTLGVTGTSTTNIINASKTTGGDTITFTNAAANNKTGFLYTDNDVVGLFTLANGQASANGVYFTSASAAVKVQVASSGVIGNFTSTGLTVTGTGSFTSTLTVGDRSALGKLILDSGNPASSTLFQPQVAFRANNALIGVVGASGAVLGSTATDLVVFAETGKTINLWANGQAIIGAQVHSTGLTVTGAVLVTGPASNYGITVNGSATAGQSALFTSQNTTATTSAVDVWHQASSGDNSFIKFFTDPSPVARGSISYNRAGGLVAYNVTSDYRAKDITGKYEASGETIDQLKVYLGMMKGATISRPMMIAHEAASVVPYAVTGEKDAEDEKGEPIYQSMDHQIFVPLLIAEIQSLRSRVKQLENRTPQ